MKKIPTLFKRNDMDRMVRDEVTPGCEWVLAGEGQATEKMDGTCCAIIDGVLYKRYELKGGKRPRADFIPAQDANSITGDIPGWILVDDGPEDAWHREAWENGKVYAQVMEEEERLPDGTYELLGPKVQGNPYGLSHHVFSKHGDKEYPDMPRDFEGIREYLRNNELEGVVWHHPDGRMAKIKRRDFGFEWPVEETNRYIRLKA